MGNGNIVFLGVTIGPDVIIGDFNTISCHCDLTSRVKLGSSNFLGSRVSILPKVKVGNETKVSAGSVCV